MSHVFKLPCPMPEERADINLALSIVRFPYQPTPSELVKAAGYSLMIIGVIDTVAGDEPRSAIFVHVSKGAMLDRDQKFYHRHLCRAISGYDSVNWNVSPTFVGLSDVQVAQWINDSLEQYIK